MIGKTVKCFEGNTEKYIYNPGFKMYFLNKI